MPVNSIEIGAMDAISDGRGALITWEVDSEKGNLGFSIYRLAPTGRELISDSIVPGAFGRTGAQTSYDEHYEYFDEAGTAGSIYYIESLSVNGERNLSPEISCRYVNSVVEASDRSIEQLRGIVKKTNGNIERQNFAVTDELSQIIQAAQMMPDIDVHRWVVSQQAVKIAVKKEGIYRVLRSDLEAAGFDPRGSSENWRLFMEGVEQAIIVGPDDQYIEFYGKGVDTVESDTRIYYLITGAVAGKRIPNKLLGNVGSVIVSPNAVVSAEKKERTNYVPVIQNGDLDNYWGRIVTNSATTIPFTLTAIDTSIGKATITVKMQGYSPTAHTVNVTVNGRSIGSFEGNNRDIFSSEDFLIPRSFLVEGENTLVLATNASNDYSLFDSVTVKYKRKYLADQDRLSFSTPGYRKINVGNFSTPNIRVFNTTFDSTPQLIMNLPVEQNGSSYTVKMPAHRPGLFYAVDDAAVMAPNSVTANTPTTLSSPTNGADMVIIAHSSPDFMTAAENWANYRRSPAGGNFSVKVVNVASIFDEFNYGVLGSSPINSFLNFAAKNWVTPPRYILILGDGSYDPRNYQGFGNWDLVPTKMVNLIYAESGSDEALADFNQDGLAEIAIGRVPARNVNAVNVALAKTMTFEAPGNPSFDRGAVFAFDLPLGFDFEAMSLVLKDELPPGTDYAMVNRGENNSQGKLLAELNKGRYVVNYAGHGSSGVWASTAFFGVGNVQSLTNIAKPTIFTMLTCLNGYFLRPEPGAEALVEPLLSWANGGSAASWASTTETTPDVQLLLATRFYHQLGVGKITRMGDLTRDAKSVIPYGSDVSYSWALFGDPALRVH